MRSCFIYHHKLSQISSQTVPSMHDITIIFLNTKYIGFCTFTLPCVNFSQMCDTGQKFNHLPSSSYLTNFVDDGRRYMRKQSRSSLDRWAMNACPDDVREGC